MKQKFVVSHDDYGHFFLAKLDDRKIVWKFLTEDLEGGNAWANRDFQEYIDIDENYDYELFSNRTWELLVSEFSGRDRLEIIEVEI